MNRNVIIVIVLVVLVLLTAVQAIQLSALKTQISSGKVNVASAGGAGSGNNAPSNIQDLNKLQPMVGGC
ncbi:hypothetical protein HYS31_06215 [Candidatus Woesearchaeota archaeon]|nr:hypothetical protein [Candidatus Woesearchaeota archaeon]